MKHELPAYIEDIVEACSNINDFIGNLNVDEYLENRIIKAAIERQFEVIGEVLNRMSREYPLAYARVRNARRIIDLRNLIAHRYDVISDERIYTIAKAQTPELMEDAKKILREFPL